MLPLLLFLGIAVPAIELLLLILISKWVGFWTTVGLILVTGALGALLWRWQGIGVWHRLRSEMISGMPRQMNRDSRDRLPSPMDALMDGAMVFFAGGLLLTPGVMTDLFGLLLLFPPSRYLFKNWIFRAIKRKFRVVDFSSQFGPAVFRHNTNQPHPFAGDQEDEDIIEGEIVSRSTSGIHDDGGEKRLGEKGVGEKSDRQDLDN